MNMYSQHMFIICNLVIKTGFKTVNTTNTIGTLLSIYTRHSEICSHLIILAALWDIISIIVQFHFHKYTSHTYIARKILNLSEWWDSKYFLINLHLLINILYFSPQWIHSENKYTHILKIKIKFKLSIYNFKIYNLITIIYLSGQLT